MEAVYSPVCTSPLEYKEPMARSPPKRSAGAGLSKLLSSVTRKKVIEDNPSPLARVLSLFDLTFLGVGTTLGVGAYVLAGKVAKTEAGPAVVLSFAIAAIASLLAGFCYAEFAARVPRAGSVYVYAYVTVGELIAFVIGWDLVLEYAIGTATVSRAVTGYVDNLVNNATSEFFREYVPMNIPHMAQYPDFIAFTVVMLLSVMVAVGVKESSYLNSVLTGLNLLTIVIVVVAGAMYANPSNWNLSLQNVTGVENAGIGGFAPFGFQGIIRGAATSFFGYVGFDIIATTSEEAKNPRRNIPMAIMISLFVVFVMYFSMATVLTMMVPYYTLNKDAPYPTAFDDIGLYAIKWIVTIGGIFALNTSLIGGMFPLPRILFAMSRDGLLFEFLGRVNSRFKTPAIATMVSGVLSAVLVLLFDLEQLVDMMSIGTLMAYSLVALCVMILRFTEDKEDLSNWSPSSAGRSQYLRMFVNAERCRKPTRSSGKVAMILITAFCAVSLALCGVMAWTNKRFYDGNLTEVVSAVFLAFVLLVILFLLCLQPQSKAEKLNFAVPLMPVVPCLSIFLNIYLMTELDALTWIRFLVWLLIGGLVYFTYSIRNSAEKRRNSTPVSVATAEMLADKVDKVDKDDLRV